MENVNKSSVENNQGRKDWSFYWDSLFVREIFYKSDCNFYLVVNDDTNQHRL